MTTDLRIILLTLTTIVILIKATLEIDLPHKHLKKAI